VRLTPELAVRDELSYGLYVVFDHAI